MSPRHRRRYIVRERILIEEQRLNDHRLNTATSTFDDHWSPEESFLFTDRMVVDGAMFDTDDLFDAAFAADFAHLREHLEDHPCFRSGTMGTFDGLFQPLRSMYRLLSHAFRWYAAKGEATFALLKAGFIDMCQDVGIVDRSKCRVMDLQRLFVAANANTKGVVHSTTKSGANDASSLTRWELLEALVRIALMKYVHDGKAKLVAEAVQMLVHDHVVRFADMVPDPDSFRRNCLYLETTERVFLQQMIELKLLFALGCNSDAKASASDSSRSGKSAGGGVVGDRGRRMTVTLSDGRGSLPSFNKHRGTSVKDLFIGEAGDGRKDADGNTILAIVLAMTMPDFQRLVEVGFGTDVNDDEAELAFVMSKITSVDEMLSINHRRLTFTDFIEAIWRLCYQSNENSPEIIFRTFVINATGSMLRAKVDRESALKFALRGGIIKGDEEAIRAGTLLNIAVPSLPKSPGKPGSPTSSSPKPPSSPNAASHPVPAPPSGTEKKKAGPADADDSDSDGE